MDSLLAIIHPLYLLSGFAVGLLVGQTGVGGGALMTPILVLLFGVHPATAVGTDLLFAAATKSVGALVHGRYGTVDWRITARLAAGSVPATLLTMVLLSHFALLDSGGARLFTIALGVTLMLTGLALLARNRIRAMTGGWSDSLAASRATALTVLAGAVLGALVSLSSVGAGAIGMTMLILLYPQRRLASLVGSDIAHAVPLTLIAGLGHWAVGSVDFGLLALLLCGSVPGVLLGSISAARVPEWLLRPILAFMLLAVGARMATSLG
jgi:uncharacterized membrane protein YfcA